MPQLSSGHVFMSYSRRDDAVMRRIVTFLRQQGIKVWVDNEKLIPGTPIWEEEIEKAIKNAPAIVVVLSPDSKNSEWVRREISLADQYRSRVFPVLVRGDEETSITLRLINRQFVDIRENEEAGLGVLEMALSQYLQGLRTQEQKEKLDAQKLARDKAKREAAEKARLDLAAKEEAQKKAEGELKAKEEAERLAAQGAEEQLIALAKTEAERKAREETEKIARAKAEQETVEREVARLKAEREEAELAARQTAEKAAKEKTKKESAEREADHLKVEQEANREKAEQDAAQKAEREAMQLTARKNSEREAAEKAKREAMELEVGRKTDREITENFVIAKVYHLTPKWTSVFWIAIASGFAWLTLWSILYLLNLTNVDYMINSTNGWTLAEIGIGIWIIPILGALVINGLITIYIFFINNIFPTLMGIFWITIGWVIGGLLGWVLNVILFLFFLKSNLIFAPMFIAGTVSGAIGGFFLIWRIREQKRIR